MKAVATMPQVTMILAIHHLAPTLCSRMLLGISNSA